MHRHGHQPRHAGSEDPTPPPGGSGVIPPRIAPVDAGALADIVEFTERLGQLAAPRRDALRAAAAELRRVPTLRAEVARLRADLAQAYARAPHLARPVSRDADLPAVGSFSGG